MTMREIASTLQTLGSEVKYRVRKDGGIRITYINGQSYTGSTGNAVARMMVGQKISEARQRQLAKIQTPKGKFGHKKLDPIPEDVKKEIRRMQRVFKKKGAKAGIPTIRKYRANVKLYGKAEANRLLKQASRYGQGLAYEENVEHLAQRIAKDGSMLDSSALLECAENVRSASFKFKEVWIQKCYGWLYDMEMKGSPSPSEVAQMINNLIK